MFIHTLKKQKNTQQSGFTLVETLVAVAILMISIAGPLVVANKGLLAAYYAKDQTTAMNLAQEGMELVRNIKDISVFNDPVNGFNNINLFKQCSKSLQCAIWLDNVGSITYSFPGCKDSDMSPCMLFKSDTAAVGYTNDSSSGKSTIFTRSFYVESLTNVEVRVTVVITWNEGDVENRMEIQNEMTPALL